MTSVYEFSTGRGPAPGVGAELPPDWLTDGIARWVRLVDPQQHEMEAGLRALDLPEDFLKTPPGNETQSRVVVYGAMALVVIPVLHPGETRAGVLRLILMPTTLITVEEKGTPAIDGVVAELHQRTGTASPLPELLVDVLEAAGSGAVPVYMSLRRNLDELAQMIENRPQDAPADALLAMKRRVAALSTLWEDQLYCRSELQSRLARISGYDRTRERLRELVSDADRSLTLLTRMEVRLRELREHLQQSLQEQTTRRLNVLAILSSIYMPATLIAGIYGMNFADIPITEIPYGYFIVISIMAVVVVGQFWYFTRRGWFK
jgi:Mg2+ and Co2+ transporter CorA